LHLETRPLERGGWVERVEGGLEKVVGSLRAPDAIRVPAGVAIVCGDEVVEVDHLLCAVADVAVTSAVVLIHALFGHLAPFGKEELGGDGDLVCGGSDRGCH